MPEEKLHNPGSLSGIKLRISSVGDETVINDAKQELSGSDVVQDQVIVIPPEIVSMILNASEFRILKRASLVCRLWQREARFYMRKRGIVHLGFRQLQKFVDMHQNSLPDLPQPFMSLDVVNLSDHSRNPPQVLSQISRVCPPLLMNVKTTPRITRLCTEHFPLDLALSLIIQCSPSLESLKIFYEPCVWVNNLPHPLSPNHIFPKLRHLEVNIHRSGYNTWHGRRNHVSSIIAWIVAIVGTSPELETFKSSVTEFHGRINRVASELLLKAKLQNIKSLFSSDWNLDGAVLEHFQSIPFSQLESLRLSLHPFNGLLQSRDVLAVIVAKCTATLRVLDLSVLKADQDFMSTFPVCPILEELTLGKLGAADFLSHCFPSLQVLNIGWIIADVLGGSWQDLTPCVPRKTLRVAFIQLGSALGRDEEPVKLFEKFPAVERVRLEAGFLLRSCRLKATGDPRSSSMLERVKHLELCGGDFDSILDFDFSAIAILKGIETITICSEIEGRITSIPFSDMPSLKVLRFPWSYGNCSMMNQLVEIPKKVGRVVVTNCCRIRWHDNPLKKKSLEEFFDAAPNAECGCGRK